MSPVIVWQCRRTMTSALSCEPWGWSNFWQSVPVDHIADGRRAEHGELCLGTMDSWVLWNLTGGKVHVCDLANASHTQLLDIHTLDWDEDLLSLFGVPYTALPDVHPSSAQFGYSAAPGCLAAGVLIVSLIGDSHAALFGQVGFFPGPVKATYGIGTSSMTPTPAAILSKRGLSTTIAWALDREHVTYALEGNISVIGAAVQWLGESLGLENPTQEVARLVEPRRDHATAQAANPF